MKKLLYSILLIATLCGLNLNLNAQLIGIDSMTINVFGLPDTIVINDNYNHTAFINNQSATPLTGTIWLMAAVDTGSGIMDIDTVGATTVNGFTQNDTASISYNEVYSFGNNYKLGGNIVVVWPISANATTIDSLFQPVYILNQTGVSEITLQHGTIAYPNPFNEQITLKIPRSNDVKQVRLIDLQGRIIKQSAFQTIMDLGQLPSGVFILEIIYTDAQREHLRIIKK